MGSCPLLTLLVYLRTPTLHSEEADDVGSRKALPSRRNRLRSGGRYCERFRVSPSLRVGCSYHVAPRKHYRLQSQPVAVLGGVGSFTSVSATGTEVHPAPTGATSVSL
jgi:hypothetical protein